VINLATSMPSSSFKMLFQSSWRTNDRIRREGSRNLAEAALAGGVRRLVQESFAPAYPSRGDEWIDESVPLEPGSYNRSVLDAEESARRFTAAGRSGVVLRFAAFYGPDSAAAGLIRLLRKRWAPLPGPRGFISSVSHDDAAAAVVASLKAGPAAYNVGDDEPVRKEVYAGTLASLLGFRRPAFPRLGDSPVRRSRFHVEPLAPDLQSEAPGRDRLAASYSSGLEGWRATLQQRLYLAS